MTNLKTLTMTIIAISSALLVSCNKEDEDAIEMEVVRRGVELIPGRDGKEYEAVDLGLPSKVLWSTCNIGAHSPQESGNFYAWGETETKAHYLWDNYEHCDGDIFSLTKYVQQGGAEDYGLGKQYDDKTVLDSIDDVAKVTMGGKWKMPTVYYFSELDRNTTKRYCKLEGVYGILFTSTRKGYEDRSIFLPIAGKFDDKKVSFNGRSGWYWASELSGKYTYMGQELNIDSDGNAVLSQYPRYVGLSVRPITKR